MNEALLLTLSLTCSGVCLAQTAASAPAVAARVTQSAPTQGGAIEKRAEHIRVEDAGARIDELRVGGETQSITVHPKGRMPTYKITPGSGERSWKILSF